MHHPPDPQLLEQDAKIDVTNLRISYALNLPSLLTQTAISNSGNTLQQYKKIKQRKGNYSKLYQIL
jgi:hypothetical protein